MLKAIMIFLPSCSAEACCETVTRRQMIHGEVHVLAPSDGEPATYNDERRDTGADRSSSGVPPQPAEKTGNGRHCRKMQPKAYSAHDLIPHPLCHAPSLKSWHACLKR